MTEHAKLSASSAEKWLNCPGSVALEKLFPQQDTEFTKEGNIAHKLAEIKIKRAFSQISNEKYYQQRNDMEINDDMEKYTDEYVDFVTEKYRKALVYSSPFLELEKKLDFSKWVKDGFGTADVVIVYNGHIEMIDLKYGQGVKVNAENNYQLMLYALGALEEYDYLYDIKSVTMTIFQPRKDNISTFQMSSKELYQWGESIKPISETAYHETGKCTSGDHCSKGFCRAIPVCRVLSKDLEGIEESLKNPNCLTNAEIAEILQKVDLLAKRAKSIKEYALKQALKGEIFPGYKVVEGRKSRSFDLSEQQIQYLLLQHGYTDDVIYKKSIRTVADYEKVIGENFEEIFGSHILVTRNPILAPIEDKRPIFNSAENDFKNIVL